jgi:hypothetical protein
MNRKTQIILCLVAAVGFGALAASPYAEDIDNSAILISAGIAVVLVASAAAVRSWWRHIHGLPPVPTSPWKKRLDALLAWVPWI